jgi:multidrug efflux pump subunit AcrB
MTELRNDDLKHGAVAWMAGHSVASNLLMLMLLIGGIIFAFRIKQEVFPELDLDEVNVSVSYPGSSPEEVERGIVLSIEEAIRGVDGVKEVRASAREGNASITAELILGADKQKVFQDIQQEVDSISSFPDDAEDPEVTISVHKRGVISIVIYGAIDELVLREITEQIRDKLLQSKNITQIELNGIREYELSVEVPSAKLREYNLTLAEISDKISKTAVEIPGGTLKTKGGEILLRMKERRDYAKDFANIPIVNTSKGTSVLLKDIATIKDTFEETDRYGLYNGKRAVMIEVYRIGDQTPIEVADEAKKIMKEIKSELPPGINYAFRNDRSSHYKQRLQLLLKNAYTGLALVLILLGLFLEARLAFWVTMGIPISFLGSMLILPGLDISINMISMFSFLIALGIVVDDAIVVGENIYNHRQEGMPYMEAAIKGAKEVATPVTFSVLTNMVTFVPIALVPGVLGKIWRNIPFVIISVFCISLFESIFILPAHLSHHTKKRGNLEESLHHLQQRFSRWFKNFVRNSYEPFLETILKYRYWTLGAALAALIMTVGYVKSGRMGMVTMPSVDADYGVVSVVLPYGSPVEEAEKIADKLIKSAKRVASEFEEGKLIVGFFSDMGKTIDGTGGSHTAEIRAYLTDPDIRPLSTKEFVDRWRKETGKIAGAESIVYESDRGGPGSGKSISIELSHRDINQLRKAGEELAAAFATYPNVKDIDDGYAPGKIQYDFNVLPAGVSLGLTANDIARQVRASFYGAEALRQQRGRSEMKVKVRLPKSERNSIYDIEKLLIHTPAGTYVPLREVCSTKIGRAYTTIERRNARRTITVTADVNPRSESDLVLNSVLSETMPLLQKKYHGLQYGFEGRMADMKESMATLKNGFVLAMLVIYVLLAIPFRSYTQPLIVMSSIPFGILGAVFGHLIMGYALSLPSMMGVIALSGVVVNDSLVLIDFANNEKAAGLTSWESIVTAAVRRFRPILLTTLTTFGGLAPMIFETSRQAKFLIPMALSLGFGILFATSITLGIVPCLYMVLDDLKMCKSKTGNTNNDTYCETEEA